MNLINYNIYLMEPTFGFGRKRSLNEEVNDELTIESMLRVRDSKTGKVADVRAMLGINNSMIKNDGLR
jgi:hypothetical protein